MEAAVGARVALTDRLREHGRLGPLVEDDEDMARIEATGADRGEDMERCGQPHPGGHPQHGPGTVEGGMHGGEPVRAAIDGREPAPPELLPVCGQDPLRGTKQNPLPGEGRIELIADNMPVE